MTLPTRTVTGTYRNLATQALDEGEIELDPYPGVWHDNDGHVVLKGGTGTVTLASGAFSVALPTTDAADVNPSAGRLWRLTERVGDGPVRTRYFALPVGDGSPVDVTQVVVAQPGTLTYLPIVGPAGPAGATGPAGPQPPLGAAGAGPTIALKSDDPTTTNARTPTAHAASHAAAGSDPVTPAAIGAETPAGAAAQIAALTALTQTKVKTADEQRTAVTAVSDDLHLFAPLEVNSVYRFRTMLLVDGPEAADASVTFTVPAGSSGGWSPVAGTLGTTVPDGSASVKMAARQFGSNSDIGVMASSATLAGLMAFPEGIVVTGATPGNLQLRWAQQTSNASPVTLKKGSSLEVVKLSGAGPSASGIRSDWPGRYPSDQGLIAWMYDPDMAGHVTVQTSASVAGRVTLSQILLRQSFTWTNIHLGLSGVETTAALANCYLGVYDSSGVLKAQTAELSATFTNAANAKAISIPWTAPFVTAPGAYYIAMLLNGTWTQNVFHFKCSGAGISVNDKLTAPGLRYSTVGTGLTALPATLDLSQQVTTVISGGWGSMYYAID